MRFSARSEHSNTFIEALNVCRLQDPRFCNQQKTLLYTSQSMVFLSKASQRFCIYFIFSNLNHEIRKIAITIDSGVRIHLGHFRGSLLLGFDRSWSVYSPSNSWIQQLSSLKRIFPKFLLRRIEITCFSTSKLQIWFIRYFLMHRECPNPGGFWNWVNSRWDNWSPDVRAQSIKYELNSDILPFEKKSPCWTP